MQDSGLPIKSSPGDRHPERVDDEFGPHVVVDRPADDSAREHIDDCRAVHLPLSRGVLGDIGAPDLVRALDREVPVDQVDVGLGQQVTHGAAAATTPVQALDPGLTHQPRDPLVVDHHPEPERELGMHPRPAVRAAGLGMNTLDVLQQQFVLLGARGSRPGTPFVEAWRRMPRTRQVTATENPSAASSRTSRKTTSGGHSPGRNTRRPV
jgi:hypothetical protein